MVRTKNKVMTGNTMPKELAEKLVIAYSTVGRWFDDKTKPE